MPRTWMVVIAMVVSATAEAQVARVADLRVGGTIAEVPLTLTASRSAHVVELRNPDAGAGTPILNVVGASGVEVPSTRGTANALMLPATTTGSFTLLVRAGTTGDFHGDVYVDGALMARGVAFSRGASFLVPDLGPDEEIVAVAPPNGIERHIAYLLSADGKQVLARTSGDATTLRGRLGGGLVLYSAPLGVLPGPLRVFRNDVLNDSDGDGLGDRLEAALGTCASASSVIPGFSCAAVADTRDTDGDGLWDAWEIMGKLQNVNGVWVRVPLNQWGANPRHKDIFVEVDFRRLTWQDNQHGLAEHMTAAAARQIARIYGDAATTDPAKRALHAQDVGNPDGQPGISLHLDTGVPPEAPGDVTIYGDWGGYSAVDAVPDGMGGFRAQTPGEAMVANFSAARQGLFHYVLGYTTGGGACGVGIACGFNMASAGNASHEFGHTLWLDHNGPVGTHEPNCKPNYPSLMNYAYYDAGYVQFSDGRGFPSLNNHALQESSGVEPDPSWINVLQSVFGYRVDPVTGSVDWNRDGSYQTSSPVRAYANYKPYDGGGCEFTREGEISVGTHSPSTPAVIRYNGLIWIFTVTQDHRLEYTYTATPGSCGPLDECQTPSFPYHAIHEIGPVSAIDAATITVNGHQLVIVVGIRPDGTLSETWMQMDGSSIIWESTVAVPATMAAGEPSVAVSRDGTAVTLIYKGIDNLVRYRFRTSAAWGPEQQMLLGAAPIPIHPNASPGLAYTGLPVGVTAFSESLIAAIADASGYIKLYVFRNFPVNGWTSLAIPYEPMYSAVGRPSMAWTGFTPIVVGSVDASAEAVAATPTTAGRFYIAYMQSNPPVSGATNPNPVRWAMSYVDGTGTFRIGLQGYFDNVWSYAFGIDFLQPNEIVLRAAETYSIPNAATHPDSLYQVTFRPHADGMSDLTYGNKNDWSVLAWAACSVLANQQAAGMKTSCPAKPW